MLGCRVQPLPDDQSVPGLRDWKWVHTPGHSKGHISLFRESDRSLIAGDAFVNVRQDSLYKVITQEKEIAGPPRYLTTDWEAAKESVKSLESLKPAVAITGHGYPVEGKELEMGLSKLAKEFDSLAKPDHGKYVE
ncbi:MBL fold metallo-hydrolase [Peribacillus simplex]|uniref:MBL fold metallo-hydrolase n=1 Tax=Peribacillus simplex TaxID=1478 RepID=UPI0035D48A59